MKKFYFGWLLLLLVQACHAPKQPVQDKPNAKDTLPAREASAAAQPDPGPDSIAVAQAFAQLCKQHWFQGLTTIDGATLFIPETPALIGDCNNDGRKDALKAFTIEGRNGGNNWTTHYAIFIQDKNGLSFCCLFNRGGDMAESIVTFDSIKDNILYGYEEPGKGFPERDTVKVQYRYAYGTLKLVSP